MKTSHRLNLLFVCCLIVLLLGLFGLPGFLVSTLFPSNSPTFSDYVDYGSFLANGAFDAGAIAIWVIAYPRLRQTRKPAARRSGYQST